MDRKKSDVYLGAVLVVGLLGVIVSLFDASIAWRIPGFAAWVWVAVRCWKTNEPFVMLLGACMYPPLALLLLVKRSPVAARSHKYDL